MKRVIAAMLAVLAVRAAGQAISQGYHTVSPMDVALISNNVTTNEQSTFQIYNEAFLQILGSNATMTLVVNETLPYFHEGGIVTSLDPLTLYSSSNQYNTSTASPDTNDKTIVVSRTTQDSVTGVWSHEVVNNNTAPLLLANGGFPYLDGILWDVQGSLTAPAGLVYLPITNVSSPTPIDLSVSYTILDNYLGKPLNSPNDVYVTRNGVVYFTDPTIGYQQQIRPAPELPNQVYAFVPNTTTIKPVADHFGNPNGITFSPDETVVYITDSVSVDRATNLSDGYRTIYAFDVVYHSTRLSPQSPPPRGEVAIFANRRVFAMPSLGIPDGIKCDSQGNVYVGAGDGIQVYDPTGVLLGKIVVGGGCSNFGFAADGRLLAMAETKLWLVQLDPAVQPAIKAGERRG